MPNPTFITITNQKGGVAKTTSAVSLAHLLARMDANVLLIDFDPQGHSSTALGLDPLPGIFQLFIAEAPISNCLQCTDRSGLTLLPSNQKSKIASSTLYMQIASGELTRLQLLDCLRAIGRDYDYVIFDTPASGIFQDLALEIADSIVIPAACDYLGMDGVRNTVATIEKLGRQGAQAIILPTLYDARNNESRYNLGLLNEAYPGSVAEPVPASAAVREAVAHGQTIWEYESKSETLGRVREAYEKLTQWIIEPPEQTLFGEEYPSEWRPGL